MQTASWVLIVSLLAGQSPSPSPRPDAPVPFGYKCSWLAIHRVKPDKVIAALKLKNVRPEGWPKGIAAAYEGQVFVSPPVRDWTLVVSTNLPDAGDGKLPNAVSPLICRLSQELGTKVQSFGTHRVVEYHAWALAEGGRIVRAYAYLGEKGITVVNEGPLTGAEKELKMEYKGDKSPDEAEVTTLAGKWSVDPSTLDEMKEPVGTGWVGSLP